MERITDYLEILFRPLTSILAGGLEYFHYSLDIPWWLSIAILTVIVRSVLFPLTIKQVKSMRAMQDLKPEMDRIRAKFKDNKQKQQEEIMKLYQERQVNPLGGCFPLLIQMPIFITMFWVIRTFGETHEDFSTGGILWFQDLSAMDPYYILPIVSAVTMLAASEITSKNLDPQQRLLMRTLPVVFAVFIYYFPAGLFMYWITSNLVTLVQNYLIYNHGPGRRPSGASGTSTAVNDGGGGANGGVLGRVLGNASTSTDRETGSDDPETGNRPNGQATRPAGKRKRRRKKKK